MDLHCNIRVHFDVCTHLSADLIIFVHGEKACCFKQEERETASDLTLKNMNEDLGRIPKVCLSPVQIKWMVIYTAKFQKAQKIP